MTKSHTPTPWKACRSHEDFNGPMFDIDKEDQEYYEGKPFTNIHGADNSMVFNAHDLFELKKANAELIVRACNSFDVLVKALEDIRAGEELGAFSPDMPSRAWRLANTALAKAKEQP